MIGKWQLEIAALIAVLLAQSLGAQETPSVTTLRLFIEPDTLTLYVVSGPLWLSDLEFRVLNTDGEVQSIRLLNGFDVLQITGGYADAGTCFVYTLSGATPPLPQVCSSNRTFRRNIPRADVFWYDFVSNLPRTVAVFGAGAPLQGELCPPALPDCSLFWHVTPSPPFIASPTFIPTTTSTDVPTMTWTPTDTLRSEGQIAFHSDRNSNLDLYIMDADGGNVHNLTNNIFNDWDGSWSPDGTRIVFSSERDGNGEIYIMDANGLNQVRLTNNNAHEWTPSWSPDGLSIVFNSQRDRNFEIYIMDADGRNQRRITNNTWDDTDPVLSPNGTQIMFQSNQDGDLEIYLMDTDGSNLHALTDNSSDDRLGRWSPDGTQIAFTSYRDGNEEIYIMDADGRNQRRITNNTWDDIAPTWSPDGLYIAFATARDGNWEIYVMDTNGQNVRRVTYNSASDVGPLWQPSAPSLSVAVENALRQIGLNPDDGEVVVKVGRHVIHATGGEGLPYWYDLPGDYTDFVVGTTIHWQGNARLDQCGLIFRKVDAGNFYLTVIAGRQNAGFDELNDYEWQGSDVTASVPDTNSFTFEFVLRAVGNALTIYIDGRHHARFQDDTLAHGGIALVVYNQSQEITCTFEDVWVWVPSSPL